MKAQIDRKMDQFILTVGTPMKALMGRFRRFFGVVAGLPVLLFIVLGTSLDFHWWRVPWPHRVSAGLLWLMVGDAFLMTIVYGLLSTLYFIGQRCGKLKISQDKRPSMAYTYLIAPLLYGLIALWGGAYLMDRGGHIFLDAGIFVYLISAIVGPWLKLLQKGETK